MNQKELLLVGGGFIAGFVICKMMNISSNPVVEKALPSTDNEVKNDLVPIKTTRPMQPSPVSADSKYDRTGMPLMQPSAVSAESDMMDAQMKNFL
jgi:hypothetical protein